MSRPKKNVEGVNDNPDTTIDFDLSSESKDTNDITAILSNEAEDEDEVIDTSIVVKDYKFPKPNEATLSEPKVATTVENTNVATTVENKPDTVTITISHKIRLLRKEAELSNWKKTNIERAKIKDESVFKIGASGSAAKNCFTYEEQDFYFPKILGNVNYTSEKFLEAVNLFYANISIQVPNNETGRELEIGFRYDNLPAHLLKDGEVLLKEQEKFKYGIPLNIQDYFIYRYALVYRFVANSIEDLYNTPNIKFCLIDSKREEVAKKTMRQKKVEAFAILNKLMEDQIKLNAVLSVLNGQFGLGLDILKMTKMEKENKVESLMETHLEDFLKVAKDQDLEYKYKINMMIMLPEVSLSRVPNTETYYYDNDLILAERTSTLISYLKNAPTEHLHRINTLNSQLQMVLNRT